MGLQQSYYAKQVGQSKVRVAEKAFFSLQMAHVGTARGQLLFVSHLLPALQGRVQRSPPLMKFDIVEMTGAMTAFCQDTVEGEGNANAYKLPHLCTPARLLQGEIVMEVLVISKSTGDTSFSSESAEVYSQQNNDRCDDSRGSE